MRAARGLLITVEGGEGSGKSTLARGLAERLREQGPSVCLTREPGGTEFGQAIERLLAGERMPSPIAELLLFEADRAQHVREVVQPALAEGMLVICDRFADSSLAYQGYGRGIDLDFIRRLNDEATGGLKPDVTLLLDVLPEVGLSREGDQSDVTGRQSLDFHERVREGFLALVKDEPERLVIIDGRLPPNDVAQAAMAAVEQRL
jgi:dTMP kinase